MGSNKEIISNKVTHSVSSIENSETSAKDVYIQNGIGAAGEVTLTSTSSYGFHVSKDGKEGINLEAGGILSGSEQADYVIVGSVTDGEINTNAGNDTVLLNKSGVSAHSLSLNAGEGDDSITSSGTLTQSTINAGTGADTISIGGMGTGSVLSYDNAGNDNITIKGTYNDGMATSNDFAGLSTGDDGGSITLDTLGTGNLQFGDEQDTLTITKTISGSLGLKDIFMQGDDDTVTLAAVSGSEIHGGAGVDNISATSLTATGALYGGDDNDTLRIGKSGLDAVARPVYSSMTAGLVDGGAGNDRIYVSNEYKDGSSYGTLSGGRVLGGAGDDQIVTTTLSGSAVIDGGENSESGQDQVNLTNMTGGSINNVEHTYIGNNMSGGTINGGAVHIIGTLSGRAVINSDGSEVNIANMAGGTVKVNDDVNEYFGAKININKNMTGGTITGAKNKERIEISENMTAGTINGGAGKDTITVEGIMSGGTINGGDTALDQTDDTITVTTLSGRGVINGQTGDDSITVTDNMLGGTINGGAGDETITITTMTAGTANAHEGADKITLTTMNGGTVNGNDGNDTIMVTNMFGGTINAGEGDNKITITGSLNDIDITTPATSSIIGGKGDDTLILSNGIELGDKYSINLGAGNNTILVQDDLSGQSLNLGLSNDNVKLDAAINNADINLGAGNDSLSFDADTATKTLTNSHITTGTGSDSIDLSSATVNSTSLYLDSAGQDTLILKDLADIQFVDSKGNDTNFSFGNDGGRLELDTWAGEDSITFGNGHDTFVLKGELATGKNINLLSGNDSLQIDGAVNGTISFNSAGQDSIKLNALVSSMLNVDNKNDGIFYYGNDGGSLELNTLTGGGIVFGTGHDRFVLHSTLTAPIDLLTGNDTLAVTGFGGSGSVKYDNRGFDSISINGEYNGTSVTSTSNGKDYNQGLSTGNDGGFIHVDSLADTVNSANLSFGNGNDHFSIGTLNVNVSLDLGLGNDSLTVGDADGADTLQALTSGNIKYNNQGLDSITINGIYEGAGVSYYDYVSKKDNNTGISTGDDGGFVHVGSLSLEGANALSFGKGNDTLSIATLDVDAQIDLGAGNDSLVVKNLNSSGAKIDLGVGNDIVTDTNLNNGFIDLGVGNNKLTGTINAGSGTVWANSGHDSIEVADMFGTAQLGSGTNRISVENELGVGGVIATGNGVDIFDIHKLHGGTVRAGDGNNTINIGVAETHVDLDSAYLSESKVYSGSGSDIINITGKSQSIIYAGEGNNRITIDGVTSGSIYTGAGADNIHFKDNVSATVSLGNGSNIITAQSLSRYIYGGAHVDTIKIIDYVDSNAQIYAKFGNDIITIGTIDDSDVSIWGEAGADRFSVGTLASGNIIGGYDNDSFNITNMNGGYANGDDGNDAFVVTNMTAGTLSGNAGNDNIRITNLSGASDSSSVQGNDGNDIFTITNMNGANVVGGLGDDAINVTTMLGGSISADDGNDKITIRTAKGSAEATLTIAAGSGDDIMSVSEARHAAVTGYFGNDKITVSTAIDSFISGGNGNDTIITTNAVRSTYDGGNGLDSISITNAYDTDIYGYRDEVHSSPASDTIRVINLTDHSNIYGSDSDDSIIVSTSKDSTSSGGDGNDSMSLGTAIDSEVYGDLWELADSTLGNDSISINTATRSEIYGDVSRSNGNHIATLGNDSIKITTATDSQIYGDYSFTSGGETFSGGNDTISITTASNSTIHAAFGADSINVINLNTSDIIAGEGNDTLTITNLNAGNGIIMGLGDDSLSITTNRSGDADIDTKLANALGAGNDTLNVNWAFNGRFDAGDDGATLITKGIGLQAELNFGDGDDGLVIKGALSGIKNENYNSDTELANALGTKGQDTLQVDWAFNGEFNEGKNDTDGAVLITKGLGANAELNFGEGNDELIINGTLNRAVNDSSKTGNLELNLGAGNDSLYVQGKTSAVDDTKLAEALDTGNDTLSVNWAFNGRFNAGDDGATLITKGLGANAVLNFGTGSDAFTSTANIAGSASKRKLIDMGEGADTVNLTTASYVDITTGVGNDSITSSGTLTQSTINAGTGDDTMSIGAMGTGSVLTYDNYGVDDITIKGTYNDGMATSNSFAGLSTGDDGGIITLDTWGTGNLQFDVGNDSLTVTKTISGSLGLKDVFMQGGADTVSLAAVSGAEIHGGAGEDSISATSLTATGAIYGGDDGDELRIGRDGLDTVARPVYSSMTAGLIDGGAGDDNIYIGNDYVGSGLYGTLSGGRVLGGAGDDYILTTTLSGSAVIDGGENTDVSEDRVSLTNMTGGSINNVEYIYIYNNMSGGTINGGNVNIFETLSGRAVINSDGSGVSADNMAGGTINGHAGIDVITIYENMTAGTINGANGIDLIEVQGIMSGGTINGGESSSAAEFDDRITIKTLSGRGIINGQSGKDSITVTDMLGGTINAGEGDDSITIATMTAGTVNGNDGNDSIAITDMLGGTINAGEGDNSITITLEDNKGSFNGSIVAGSGDDTLILGNGVEFGDKFNINLGAGTNEIQLSSKLVGTSLTLGTGHDNLVLKAVIDSASLNLNSGNDTLTTENKITNSTINAGAGNNSITIKDADSSSIFGGTGHDSFTVTGTLDTYSTINASTGNDLLDLSSATIKNGSTIAYDNRGLDTIKLADYTDGIITDTAGNIVDLSTGTDGGRIELKAWTSGDITFGHGHDIFILDDADGETLASLNKDINLLSGNDYVSVEKLGAGTIYYDNRGQDSLVIKGGYDGSGIENTYAPTSHAALSTGTDGGSIELGRWTDGDITFGNGHDTFVVHSGGLADNIELGLGNDKVSVEDLTRGTGNISYDNRGQDSIIINGEYDSTGVTSTSNGKDYNQGLSTGTDGGYIHVNSLADTVNSTNLSFGNGHDHLSIGYLDVDISLDLGLGNDSLTVGGADGADTLQALIDGNIKYHNQGMDSITIHGEYTGTGVSYYDYVSKTDNNSGISTGDDGGYVHVGSLSLKGANALSFGKGNDIFSVNEFDVVDANIDLGLGNDSLVFMTLKNGTINLGDGNNHVTDRNDAPSQASVEAGVTIISGSGHDSIELQRFNGKLDAGNGNNKINVQVLGVDAADANPDAETAEILTGTGADSITIGTMQSGIINSEGARTGNDTITITQMQGGQVLAGDGNDSVTITTMNIGAYNVSGDDGNDTIRVTTMESGNVLTGKGNDSISVDKLITGTVNGGSGVDRITIGEMTGGTVYGSDQFATPDISNDIIKITSMSGGTVYGNEGNDSITITTMSDADLEDENVTDVNGDVGNDTITITHMSGGTVNGDAGADRITVTTMNDGTVNGGDDKDTIKVITMHSGTVSGGAADDSITVTTMNGTVSGGSGVDRINITTLNGGDVSGGEGNDTITITTMNAGVVSGDVATAGSGGVGSNPDEEGGGAPSEGGSAPDEGGSAPAEGGSVPGGEEPVNENDIISITNMYGGYVYGENGDDSIKITNLKGNIGEDAPKVYGESGDDTFTITTATRAIIDSGNHDDKISVTTAIDSIVNGDKGIDTITSTTANRSVYSGGEGSDSINITNVYTANIYGDNTSITFANANAESSYNDTIRVTNVYDHSNIYGGIGNDSVYVTAVNNSSIYGDDGDDLISIGSLNNGGVHGGLGNDNITITTLNNGSVHGDAGDDSISIKNITGSEISIVGGEGADTLSLGRNQRVDIHYDFDGDAGDTFFIGSQEYTSTLVEAQEAGHDSVTIGLVDIYFIS